MDIYKIAEINVTIIFILTWIPLIYKVIKEKSATSYSLLHLITMLLGFISNSIYSWSFKDKYIFFMYLFDIFSITIIIFYKIYFK